jgi:hypothetical protein
LGKVVRSSTWERISIPFCAAHAVKEGLEAPGSGDIGVKLAEASGRGVAGIGEKRLARPLPLLIQPAKGLLFHVHLAPDFEKPRDFPIEREKAKRYLLYGAQISRHILAHSAIAPG